MNSINLGNMEIPAIKPQKGVDYYTEVEKEELIQETTTKVYQIIEPKELERQTSEATRKSNENDRKTQESTRTASENERQSNEDARQSNEVTRQTNEQSRIEAEQSRNTAFTTQMTENEKAIQNVKDKTEEYNSNAEIKTNEFNLNAEQKTQTFNENANTKLQEINQIKDTTEAQIAVIKEKDTTQDTKIGALESDNETNKQNILDIQAKNAEQDTTIEELKAENIELKAENERLNNDINAISVTVPAEGENITLNDTSEARFKKFVIGGNSWQETRSGKNIFDNTLENYGHYGEIATTISTGVRMTANQTVTASESLFGVYAIMDLSNYVGKTVRMKATYKSNSTLNGRYVIGLCASDGANRSLKVNSSSSGQEISFIVPELATGQEYLGVWFYANYNGSGISGDYVDYTDVIITIDNADMTYEPYGEMPSTEFKSDIRNCGDNVNLYDGNELNSSVTYNSQLCTDKNSIWYTNVDVSKLKFPLTFSSDITVNNNNYTQTNIRVSLRNANNKDVKLIAGNNATASNKKSSLTILSDDITDEIKYIFLGVRIQDGGYTENTKIEQGMKATSYSPYGQGNANFRITNGLEDTDTNYQEQNFTFPLQEGQRLAKGDYLADDGIHHKRKQIVLDGTEKWQDHPTQIEGYYKAFTADIKTNSKFSSATNPLCNYFIAKSVSYVAENNSGIYSSQYATYISVSDTVATNVNELKAYLAEQYANGTPVVIEYELAEEEIEAYTEEQQAVYNEIKKTAHSYSGQTHIFSTDETSLIFNVEARKNMNTLVTRIEKLESEV